MKLRPQSCSLGQAGAAPRLAIIPAKKADALDKAATAAGDRHVPGARSFKGNYDDNDAHVNNKVRLSFTQAWSSWQS